MEILMFDYCFKKLQNSFKINAGRLLLNVTRGVYYLKTKTKQILIHYYKRSFKWQQKCNANFKFKNRFCASVARGLTKSNATPSAFEITAGNAGLKLKTFLKTDVKPSALDDAGNAKQK